MLRKTDSGNPADWLYLASSDLEGIRDLATRELAYHLCRSKLAEVIEKILKAELIRCGWLLEKTHDLMRLLELIEQRSPDLLAASEPLALNLAESYFRERYPGLISRIPIGWTCSPRCRRPNLSCRLSRRSLARSGVTTRTTAANAKCLSGIPSQTGCECHA